MKLNYCIFSCVFMLQAVIAANGFTITCERGDILQDGADVVVNAANCRLQRGGGICGRIFSAANADRLKRACQLALRAKGVVDLKVADVAVTDVCGIAGFKKIFHVVSPNFNKNNTMQTSQSFDQQGKELLGQCYTNILQEAASRGFISLRVPFLSGGNFCANLSYLPEMAEIAVGSVRKFCSESSRNLKVTFVLFGLRDYDLFVDEIKKYNAIS